MQLAPSAPASHAAALLGMDAFPVSYRVQVEQVALETEVLQLTERVYLAAEHVRKIGREVEARIQMEQASVRERITELEYLWQERVAQEQMERKQTQGPDSNLSPFMVYKLRREMKAQDLRLAAAGRTLVDSRHKTGTAAEPREFGKVVSRIGK